MGSDRARLSYDAKQHYRSVVAQQGRVTLEADSNEAQQIIEEELREETLDFVGSSGTPDDGYRVIETGNRVIETESSTTAPFDFAVQSGTLYVGGIRAFLGDPAQPAKQLFKYSDQTKTDWLDYKNDPDWVDLPRNFHLSNEFIYLYLREQEVSAVEDSALLDPALGGPDTTQRSRLIQRIVRLSTSGTECSSALETAITVWQNKGLNFDSKTMRLMSAATLKVDTIESASPSDPCDPAAQGGYLGAENQLIRVQISGFDSAKNQYKFVWGFDNASFLYRVKAKNNTTLQLQSQPVDDFHRPRQGQTVEVLRSAAKLSNGEYVASATGFVTTLAASYNPVSQEITLPSLPNEYLDASQTPQLFLRVWEEEKPFESGESVILGDTGLQVILQTSGNQPFYVSDYWIFAVRPTTPTEVYPKRYLEAPQPPDGPRLWVCPLAVIGLKERSLEVLEDCRQHFDNLVELTKRKFSGGCCTVTVRPEDVTTKQTLQDIIDQHHPIDNIPLTVCLMPGKYLLTAPLRFGSRHSHLTLEGCHDGVILQADDKDINQFLDGLIVVSEAKNVALRQLQLELPLVPLATSVKNFNNGVSKLLVDKFLTERNDISAAIGIRPVNCTNLTIQNCIFNFSFRTELNVFGAGIFAGGACDGLTVQGNQFVQEVVPKGLRSVASPSKLVKTLAEREVSPSVASSSGSLETPATREGSPGVLNPGVQDAIATFTADAPGKSRQPFHILFGYLQLPSGTLTSSISDTMGQVMRSLLQDAFFLNNQFTGLSFATLIISDIGAAKFKDNTVRECLAGFWLESLGFWTLEKETLEGNLLFKLDINEEKEVFKKISFHAIYGDSGTVFDKVTIFGMELALFYPLPQLFRPRDKSIVTIETTQKEQFLLEIQPFLAAAHEPGLSLYVHFSDNAIDALTKTKDEPSSIGLLILGNSPRNNGIDLREIIVSANKIRNRASNTPTTVILLAQRCTITGNLILNEAPSNGNDENRFSLVFLPLSGSNQFSITGNVLQGKSTLGVLRRSDYGAPPLNTWLFANSCND